MRVDLRPLGRGMFAKRAMLFFSYDQDVEHDLGVGSKKKQLVDPTVDVDETEHRNQDANNGGVVVADRVHRGDGNGGDSPAVAVREQRVVANGVHRGDGDAAFDDSRALGRTLRVVVADGVQQCHGA